MYQTRASSGAKPSRIGIALKRHHWQIWNDGAVKCGKIQPAQLPVAVADAEDVLQKSVRRNVKEWGRWRHYSLTRTVVLFWAFKVQETQTKPVQTTACKVVWQVGLILSTALENPGRLILPLLLPAGSAWSRCRRRQRPPRPPSVWLPLTPLYPSHPLSTFRWTASFWRCALFGWLT